MISTTVQRTEHFLSSKNGYKKSWTRIFLAYGFAIFIFSLFIGLARTWVFADGASGIWKENNDTLYYTNAGFIIAIIGYSFLVLPIIVILSSWIVGINQTTRSKYFHLFFYTTSFIAIVLALAICVLMIRSSIPSYNY